MPDRSKLFIVNGSPRLRAPKPAPQPTTSLGALTLYGFPGSHFYLFGNANKPTNSFNVRGLGIWSDNKSGVNNELLLIDIRTAANSVQVYYTLAPFPNYSIKTISSVRVVHNGSSTTYTTTNRVTRGPLTISIYKSPGFSNSVYFSMSCPTTNNLTKLSGAIVPIIKRMVLNNGVFWRGAFGWTADGIGQAASIYGLSRSSFETSNISIQSEDMNDLSLFDSEASFAANTLSEDCAQEEDIRSYMNDDSTGVSIFDGSNPFESEILGVLSPGYDNTMDTELAAIGYLQYSGQNIDYIP